MRRAIVVLGVLGSIVAGPAVLACGGLVAPNGTVQLGRTTTLAAYHDGVEHYVTAFEFFGGGTEFGSIVPLPAMPTKVERGGDWTLQRLVRETRPRNSGQPTALAVAGSRGGAQVVYETRIDALDITIVKGGGPGVVEWARSKGFDLSPDAPATFSYYARRSPYFMAAEFDAEEAGKRGQTRGDGTPIHLTIPTADPWVPLRILALGKPGAEVVGADVYLLTDRRPALLPLRAPGWVLERRERASTRLLDDLRSDKGMEWVPREAWLTYFKMDSPASTIRYDLAVDADGRNPSWDWAGLTPPATPVPPTPEPTPVPPTPERSDEPRPLAVALAAASAKPGRSVPLVVATAVVLVAGIAATGWALGGRRR